MFGFLELHANRCDIEDGLAPSLVLVSLGEDYWSVSESDADLVRIVLGRLGGVIDISKPRSAEAYDSKLVYSGNGFMGTCKALIDNMVEQWALSGEVRRRNLLNEPLYLI